MQADEDEEVSIHLSTHKHSSHGTDPFHSGITTSTHQQDLYSNSSAQMYGIDSDMGSMPTRNSQKKTWGTYNSTEICIGCFLCMILTLLIIIMSLGAYTVQYLNSELTDLYTVSTAETALSLPSPYTDYTWTDVKSAAYGRTVKIWMYGPGAASSWFNDWLAAKLSAEYAISLNMTYLSSTTAAVNQIAAEFAAGDTESGGAIDMVWINGDNFYNAKTAGYLWGPWATKVPSEENFDWTAAELAYDFGTSTEGRSMPFFSAQIILIYNTQFISNAQLPASMDELVTACTDSAHPLYRKFAYPDPTADYVGSAFIRMFLLEFGGGYLNFEGDYNLGTYEANKAPALAKLSTLQSGLFQNGGSSPYFCTSWTDCSAKFASGDIYMTLAYSATYAGTQMAAGVYPSSTSSYVPDSGSLSNVNFFAIPGNSDEKLAASVVGNYIGSIGAQFNRRASANRWIQAYSETCDAIADEDRGGWESAFEYLDDYVNYNTTPATAYLRSPYALPEINSQYKTQFNADWDTCIQNDGTANGASGCV